MRTAEPLRDGLLGGGLPRAGVASEPVPDAVADDSAAEQQPHHCADGGAICSADERADGTDAVAYGVADGRADIADRRSNARAVDGAHALADAHFAGAADVAADEGADDTADTAWGQHYADEESDEAADFNPERRERRAPDVAVDPFLRVHLARARARGVEKEL